MRVVVVCLVVVVSGILRSLLDCFMFLHIITMCIFLLTFFLPQKARMAFFCWGKSTSWPRHVVKVVVPLQWILFLCLNNIIVKVSCDSIFSNQDEWSSDTWFEFVGRHWGLRVEISLLECGHYQLWYLWVLALHSGRYLEPNMSQTKPNANDTHRLFGYFLTLSLDLVISRL